MQQLNDFLKHANYAPLFDVSAAAVGIVAFGMIVIAVLHTLYVVTKKSPLYSGKKPVDGWNKRFYPVSFAMIIFLLILMWMLNAWSHRLSPQ
jgi:hypothetical protein